MQSNCNCGTNIPWLQAGIILAVSVRSFVFFTVKLEMPMALHRRPFSTSCSMACHVRESGIIYPSFQSIVIPFLHSLNSQAVYYLPENSVNFQSDVNGKSTIFSPPTEKFLK